MTEGGRQAILSYMRRLSKVWDADTFPNLPCLVSETDADDPSATWQIDQHNDIFANFLPEEGVIRIRCRYPTQESRLQAMGCLLQGQWDLHNEFGTYDSVTVMLERFHMKDLASLVCQLAARIQYANSQSPPDVQPRGLQLFERYQKLWQRLSCAMGFDAVIEAVDGDLFLASAEAYAQKTSALGSGAFHEDAIAHIHAHGQCGSFPAFPFQDWQHEVSQGNTQRGYWDWVSATLEERDHDRATGQDPEERCGKPMGQLTCVRRKGHGGPCID